MIPIQNKRTIIHVSYDFRPALTGYDFETLREKIYVIMQDRCLLEKMINNGEDLLIEAALNKVCDPKTTFKKEAEKYNLLALPVRKTGAIVRSAMTTEISFEYNKKYYILKEYDILSWEVQLNYEKTATMCVSKLFQTMKEKLSIGKNI